MKFYCDWIVFLPFFCISHAFQTEILCYNGPPNDITLECKHNKHHRVADFDDLTMLNAVHLIQNKNGCDSENYLGDARKIQFQWCLIPYIPLNLFSKLKKAEKVEMNKAGLKRLDAKRFPEDSALKVLEMRYNNLTSIEYDLCSNARKIKEVDFSYNQITDVDKMAFAGCWTSLQKIVLESNKIRSISFGNVTFLDLKYINLQLNKIVRLDCNSFPTTRTPPVLDLDVSYNELENIDFNCDKYYDELNVHVDQNNLESITFPASQMVTNLRQMSANQNQISSISIQMNMEELKWFSISANKLVDLSEISRCSVLETLDLSYNSIEYLDARSFHKMSHIQQLNLEGNNISEIRRGAFSYQRNLTELNLSHNKLQNINLDRFLPYYENLTAFYLNDNNLTAIIGWDRALFPNLKTLAISENDFDCEYLEQFLRNFRSRSIYLMPSSSPTGYSCGTNSVYGISCVENEPWCR